MEMWPVTSKHFKFLPSFHQGWQVPSSGEGKEYPETKHQLLI